MTKKPDPLPPPEPPIPTTDGLWRHDPETNTLVRTDVPAEEAPQ